MDHTDVNILSSVIHIKLYKKTWWNTTFLNKTSSIAVMFVLKILYLASYFPVWPSFFLSNVTSSHNHENGKQCIFCTTDSAPDHLHTYLTPFPPLQATLTLLLTQELMESSDMYRSDSILYLAISFPIQSPFLFSGATSIHVLTEIDLKLYTS